MTDKSNWSEKAIQKQQENLQGDAPVWGDKEMPAWGIPVEEPDKWTTDQLEGLAKEAFAAKRLADEHQQKEKNHRARQHEIEAAIQKYLEFYNKEKYISAVGDINIRTRHSFKIPKEPKDKKALFEWMQKKGIFWQYVNVNSQSLNSLMKSEMEAAEVSGESFSVPGISEATEYKRISLKEKK